MEIIDRYVYAVTKRLPEKGRQEVDRELRANINDMLPEGYSEADAKEVLNKLGNPAKLADEYRETKRYLIGPAVYDSYMATLKLIAGIVIPIAAVTILISALAEMNQSAGLINNVIEIIAEMIAGAVTAGLQVALWVTVGFAIAERTDGGSGQLPFANNSWSVDKLEPIPAAGTQKISRAESIFDMVWVIVVTGILLYAPQIIGIYTKADSGSLTLHESLFNLTVLRAFTPLITAVALVGLLKAILKVIHQYWNPLLAIVNTLGNVLFMVLVYGMFTNERLFNPQFKAWMSNAMKMDATLFNKAWDNIFSVALVVFLIICIADTISGFWKAWRAQSKQLAQ